MTDAEKAKEYREKISSALTVVCAIMAQAKKNDNMEISFSLGGNTQGVVEVQNLKVVKHLEL